MRRGWITPLAFMYTYIGQTFIHQPVGELFKSFQYKMIEYIFVLKRGESCPALLYQYTTLVELTHCALIQVLYTVRNLKYALIFENGRLRNIL